MRSLSQASALNAVAVVIAGLLGLAIGSFLNVVIHRVPRGESLSTPGSHCPACHHPIRARHNVPVLGWLILRGRCADCAAPISPRYPLVELLTGVLFVAANPFAPLEYLANIAFLLKMACVVLAGLNALAFYVTGLSRAVNELRAGDDAPWSAKLVAGTSLSLWIGVIAFGRLMPWLGEAF